MTRILRTLARRLQDERGMALVLAIGIATVLAVAGASLIVYSISNEHHANRSRADVRVYNLAQVGVENAAAQIGQQPQDLRDNPAIFSSLTTAQKTETFGSGESVVWDAQLWDDRTGALYVPGSPYYIPKLRWHVTSTSTMPDPSTGAGDTITRTLQADIQLTPVRTQDVDSEAWRYVYSKADDGDTSEPDGCDITLPNNPNVRASFYVTGDLCLQNNSQIIGSGTPDPVDVIVHGWIYNVSPQAWVGTNADPVNHTEIGLKCKHRNRSPRTRAAARAAAGVLVLRALRPGRAPGDDRDHATRRRLHRVVRAGSPGPKDPCDASLSSAPATWPVFEDEPFGSATRNGSAPTLFLIGHPAFHCETLQGLIDWDPTNLKLTVEGTIYFDGNIELSGSPPTDIEYSGIGAIYTTGHVILQQVRLCAEAATTCDSSWDGAPPTPMLLIASDGRSNLSQCPDCSILLETSAGFQGALYASHNIGMQNSSLVQGPMIAQEEIIQNGFTFYPIPRFAQVPFGTPNTPIVNWGILPPTNYTG